MKKNNKGFSLVELIVVVLIMGILAVALTPQVMKWVDRSRIAADKDTLQAVKTASALAFTKSTVYGQGAVTITLGSSSSATGNTGFNAAFEEYAGGPITSFTFKKSYSGGCTLTYTTNGVLDIANTTIPSELSSEIQNN